MQSQGMGKRNRSEGFRKPVMQFMMDIQAGRREERRKTNRRYEATEAMRKCTHAHTCAYTHMRTRVHICTYMHTHVQTCVHTQRHM